MLEADWGVLRLFFQKSNIDAEVHPPTLYKVMLVVSCIGGAGPLNPKP